MMKINIDLNEIERKEKLSTFLCSSFQLFLDYLLFNCNQQILDSALLSNSTLMSFIVFDVIKEICYNYNTSKTV